MSDLQEVNFSDLIQLPNETVEKLMSARRRSLRVLRRGSEDDLILTAAPQAAQDAELIEVATRPLRAVMSNTVIRATDLLEILSKVFPWIRFLTDEDRMAFAQGLTEVVDAREDLGSPAPVLQLITEWRHTAEVHARRAAPTSL